MTRHASEEELRGGAREGAPTFAAHAGRCAPCREAADLYRNLRVFADAPAAASACPDPLALLRHAALPAASRLGSVLGPHLGACHDCAAELESIERMLAGTPRAPVAPRVAPVASLAARLRALVAFDMPAQLVLNPRGEKLAAGREQRAAMKLYGEGRYREAASALARLRRTAARPAGLSLYLGATLLRLGRAAAALGALEEAAAERGRAAEARWYLAQALLRLGRGAEALSVLRVLGRQRSALRGPARALALRIEEVLAGTAP